MDEVQTLIVGAGVSGLATAAFLKQSDCLILERDSEIGGYCKTIQKEGFIWDYSGHFFHFKHPEIEQYLRARMPGQRVRTVTKKSFIAYKNRWIDFPFQKNIHQLPQDEFIDCLYDLYFARTNPVEKERNFKEMLYYRFGKSISEKFLIPYNEKLYACDLSTLDRDAMGRFFPHADLAEIIRNMRESNNTSYNSTFTYPEGGAIQYIYALASEVPEKYISLNEHLVKVDLRQRIAYTNQRSIRYERLVSSIPFNQLVQCIGFAHDSTLFNWNQVLVFNLGFNKKGPRDVHWVYYPDPNRIFYRIGFYDNIFDSDRLSLYIEIGLKKDETIDIAYARQRVLEDLRAEKIITDHQLVAEHSVTMNPAYVHITQASMAEVGRLKRVLQAHGVYSIGRYGGWTYCSIEDNIVEAKRLVEDFEPQLV